jgi:undecaprenyl-diphosphatase
MSLPSASEILAGATQIATHATAVAILWHVALGAGIVALGWGFRPLRGSAAVLSLLPLASVAVAAWVFGNPLNGAVFSALSVALSVVALRLPFAPMETGRGPLRAIGALMLALGWLYPHFLGTDSLYAYLYAAPLGLLPCPTLSAAIGITLIACGFGSRAWSRILASAGVAYGVVGVVWLGVWLDVGLLIGALTLAYVGERLPPMRAVHTAKRRNLSGHASALALLLLTPARASADDPRPPPFTADVITDGAIVSVSLGFGALSELVITTGEIVPQQPQPASRLLSIDRLALHKHEASAAPTSTIAALAALAYAVADPVITGYRDGASDGVVDAVIYAEALALTWAATNLAKLTVRRPRPAAYQEQERLYEQYGMEDAPSITETDTSLSFFSGHTALTATVASTATYLAFVRSPGTARPWITLSAGTALTAFVGVQRARAGEHFPTDVIAAAMAGAGIGLLVAHLHRADAPPAERSSLWLGFDGGHGGGTLVLGGQLGD